MADVAGVWTRERPAPRRRAPSVERIVEQAVAIADDEGLEALSMRRVSAELGSGTASLYRYVASRDELLDLMIDTVQGEQEPPAPTGDWRADLTATALHLRAAMLRHPWLSAELTGRPGLGPNALRRIDTALAAAAGCTTDAATAGRLVETVLSYVFGAVATELAERQAIRRSGLTERQWQASVAPYLKQVFSSGLYPHLARQVTEGAETDAGQRFAFGLEVVLDGVAARSSLR